MSGRLPGTGGAGYDIRTVQELLGHRDVSPTMICTQVLLQGGAEFAARRTYCRGDLRSLEAFPVYSAVEMH